MNEQSPILKNKIVTNTENINSCPFCGENDLIFVESEDYGGITCKCGGSFFIPLNELPDYFEQNCNLQNCKIETKQLLIDKWNYRTIIFGEEYNIIKKDQ